MKLLRTLPCALALVAGNLAACGEDPETGGAGGGNTGGNTGGDGGSSSQNGGGPGVDWTTVNHLTVVELGTVDTSKNPEIEFEVPDRTLGFTLIADIEDPARKVGISQMSRVGGQNVVESFDLPGRFQPQFLSPQDVAAQNPQTDLPDAMPLATGEWRALLKAEDPVTAVRARLLVRRTSDGLFHGGAVDIAVRVAPEAATQAYVEQVLSTMFNEVVSPQVGLDQGELTFDDLAAEYGSVDTDAEFHEMVRTTATDPKFPRLNLYVVSAMPVFPEAYAFAGGIPGPTLPGTSTHAVVWIPTGSLELDAVVLAHEYGHLAGLFHVREFAGSEDVLDDTLFGDPTNLLRPTAAVTATTLSPKQITVIQASALYRGILEDGAEPEPALGAMPEAEPKWRHDAEVEPRAPRSDLEALLASHWCARSPGLLDHVWSQARTQADALVDLAADNAAPPFVRLRALLLVERFADAAQRERGAKLLRALAKDTKQPLALRSWASRRVAAFVDGGVR